MLRILHMEGRKGKEAGVIFFPPSEMEHQPRITCASCLVYVEMKQYTHIVEHSLIFAVLWNVISICMCATAAALVQ